MRLFAICLSLSMLLGLAGCGPNLEYWCHPTKHMQTSFPKDKYECEGDAYHRAKERGQVGDEDIIEEEWQKCMRVRGWSPCPKPQEY